MVSADIYQDTPSFEADAPRITLGDYFVVVAAGVVVMALAAGLMAQLGTGILIAVAIAATTFVALMAGHFALRRADGRLNTQSVTEPASDVDHTKQLDRRLADVGAARSKLPSTMAVKKQPTPKTSADHAVAEAVPAGGKEKSLKVAAKATDSDGVALKDMDLGNFRPRSPADLAQPSQKPTTGDPDSNGSIDDMIKRLADDIEAGRKPVSDVGQTLPTDQVKSGSPDAASSAALAQAALAGLSVAASPADTVVKQSSAPIAATLPPPIPPIGAAAVSSSASMPRHAPTMIEAATPPALPTQSPKGPQSATAKLAAIADALSDEHMDVFLETINDLEDYRAEHYEVSVRLRLGDGNVLDNSAFIEETRGTGLLPLLEAVKVSSTKRLAVQMIRRGRTGDFFSTVDGEALADQQFGEDIDTITAGDAGLASRLVLAFTQNDVRNLTPAQVSTLESIAALGFRFSIEDITELDMDFEQLAGRGFKFVKLDADVFLAGLPTGTIRVPSQDICSHLARSGLSVIVGKISDETARAKILGFGAIFGQGSLFGAARPVRADMLRPSEQRPPAM